MNTSFVRPDVALLLQMLKSADGPQMHDVEPSAAREMYTKMACLAEADPVALGRVEDLSCPGPSGEIRLRLYDPQAKRTKPCNVVCFYHGGGFVIGNLETHHSFCTFLAKHLDLPVVAVDYRLAPEFPFPAAPIDCEAATRWIAENGAQLGLMITGLIPCGDSAGGNLAIVTAQSLASKSAAKPVVAQFPIYPATRMDAEGGSMNIFNDGYVLTEASMAYFNKHYNSDPKDVRVSAYLGNLKGTAPTVLVTAGLDPLRDQGRDYAAQLIMQGVDVIYMEMQGTVHGFINMRKLVPSAQSDVERMCKTYNLMLANI
jgi:acetyl esterase